MATVVDYQYIPEVSTLDALHNLASDTTNWYSQDLPWVNTFLINWANQVTNIPEWEGWLWIAGWSTNVRWTAWVWTISWTSGDINLPDWTQISISSGSVNIVAPTYIYVDMEDWTVYSTTHSYEAVWENKIMICAAFPNTWKNVTFKAFGCADQSSLTTWADIAARTIVASNIASWEITANEIASNTITANEIKSWAVTASKIDVSQLSAISANLWTITAWDITGTTITAWSTSWTAVKLSPSNNRLEFYYWWNLVGYIGWWSVDGNWWILLDASFVGIIWREVMDLKNAKLQIPVWTDLYW